MTDTLAAPTGSLAVRVWRHGVLIEDSLHNNLIVGGSKLIHAQLLGGAVAGNSIVEVGFGSTLSPAAPGNTSLSLDAYTKAVDDITYPLPNQVSFHITLGNLEANGQLISEYGLLTASGALYARLVRSAPLIKDLSMALDAQWTVTF